ncbi:MULTISPECIES: tape measure protein [unclassified Acinetobacter]|uniref:tape measure protein n=1 Tax=unclassified Acinetobacter TaxID=196816 RepID=UPI00211EDD39|nr:MULTISPECIES: tape measure protein [unclassified Acinetobacter]
MAQESVLRIVIDSRNAERNARALANELDSIEKKGDFASKSMDSMSVATRQLAGYMAGVVTVGAAISKMDAYTGMQNRLKLVTESQEQLNLAMSDTFSIAQKSYQSWDSVIQVYQRFSDNAKTLRIDMAKTAELTETVSKAVAISGASTQAAEAALTQFGQALASGVLRGEELNSVMEQTPALAKAIAQGMGITVGQLRSVAAEGKITGEVLVDALTKSKQSVDELFSKTDITIGQSIQLLSNEVTKFTGEAGKASGAATMLASSIQVLANNLDAIAGVAMIGGVAMLTKTILTQTVAIRGSITESLKKNAANLSEISTNAALTASEARKTGAIAQYTTMQLADAKATAARMTGMQRLSYIQSTVIPLEAKATQATTAHAAATAADTLAQEANNKARSRAAALYSLIGGPIGAITIGVAALTAGYMYLQKRTAEANAKLEEQGKVANKTKEELLALRGVQLDVAKDDLKASFEAQNEALHKANIAFNGFIATIAKSKQSSIEAKEIYDQVRQGLISQEEAIERLNRLNLLTPEQKSQGLDFLNIYDDARRKAQENADAQRVLGVEVTLAGNASSNAAGKHNDNANSLNNVESAARGAANAMSEYTAQALQSGKQAQITNTLLSKGYSLGVARDLADVAAKNGKVTREEAAAIIYKNQQQEKLNKSTQKYTASTKASRKSSGSSSSSRSAAAAERKQARDAERLAEEIGHIQEDVAYRYADHEKQIELNLQKELAEMRKGGVDKNYQDRAIHRADIEKQVYRAQLEYELNEFKWTERQKLEQKHKIDQLSLNLNEQFSAKELTDRSKALYQQHQHELGLLELAKEQRIFQAQQALYSEMELIKRRYELERQEIARTVNDPNERAELLNGSFASQSKDESGVRDRTISDYRGVMGFEESPLVKQFEVLDKMRELDLISEEKYQQDKLMLQTKYSASYMQSMLGGFMSLVDENSSAYAAMFAAQKAFAVAQALMNIPATYSNTVNAVSAIPLIGPYIAPAMGAAAAALQVAQAASIKSTNMTGFKSGGYTGNYGTNQVAGVVHGQEYVLNAEATKRVGVNTLNAINNGSTIQAEKQAQANAKASSGKPQTIDNNLRVIMVKDENEAKDWLYGPEGEKAFLYHMKRNRSKF